MNTTLEQSMLPTITASESSLEPKDVPLSVSVVPPAVGQLLVVEAPSTQPRTVLITGGVT